MATENKSIIGNDQWQMVTSASEFLLTNESAYPVSVCFSSSTPSESLDGHSLNKGDGIIRGGFVGNVYVKAGHKAALSVTE